MGHSCRLDTKRSDKITGRKDSGNSEKTQERLSHYTRDGAVDSNAPAKYVTVGELNSRIRSMLDADEDIHGIWLLGEFSNIKQYPSGHIYGVLKDQLSEIRCVIWRNFAGAIGVRPKDGMKAFCFGDVIVAEQRGRYEFSITNIIEAGAGAFFLKMELLKTKLRGEGLFDRKRPIPSMPSVIALVTSGAGAVIHDMLKIISRRFPLVRVIVLPVKVQGDGASEEIARAIARANSMEAAGPDVIVLARGGGSIEDLWAFNEERVARAIYASAIPVVTGIGHQTDFTIADFVADLRAATPSEAAEKVVPDRAQLTSALRDRAGILLSKALLAVRFGEQQLDASTESLHKTMEHYTVSKIQEFDHLRELLESLEPSSVLHRGYAVVEKEGSVVTSITAVAAGDTLKVTVADGTIGADVKEVSGGD